MHSMRHRYTIYPVAQRVNQYLTKLRINAIRNRQFTPGIRSFIRCWFNFYADRLFTFYNFFNHRQINKSKKYTFLEIVIINKESENMIRKEEHTRHGRSEERIGIILMSEERE